MKGNPLFVHCCHCLHCQRETGGGFAINVLIEADRVHLLQGKTEETSIPTESGREQVISRCRDCKTAIWCVYSGMGPKVRFVKAGTTDQPARYRPDIHIFTESKLPWVKLQANIPAVPQFYKLRDIWSGQSLNRLKALKETDG